MVSILSVYHERAAFFTPLFTKNSFGSILYILYNVVSFSRLGLVSFTGLQPRDIALSKCA